MAGHPAGLVGVVRRMSEAIKTTWRALWIPKAVRELEDAGVESVAHGSLPPTPPPVERRDIEQLHDAQKRLRRVEQEERRIKERMEEMADLFGRDGGR